MQRGLFATLILFISSLMLIGCTTSSLTDGRVVTEGGTPAKDDRIWYYEYQADQGRSAVWTDERLCLLTIDTVAVEADAVLNDYYAELTGVPYKLPYSTENMLQDYIDEATELDDTKLLRALENVPPLGHAVAQGSLTFKEAYEVITEACDPNEHSEDELDNILASAIQQSEQLSEMRLAAFGTGPEFDPIAGQYQKMHDTIQDANSNGASPEITLKEDTCEELLARLVVQYAHGEINAEQVLAPFPEDQHEFLLEHLDFVQEEIGAGTIHPDDTGTLMGQITLGEKCTME